MSGITANTVVKIKTTLRSP